MPIHNIDIARAFDEVADLLELEEANPFRVRAYRNAARSLRGLDTEVANLLRRHTDLAELPGIGKDLAGKIHDYVETGRSEEHTSELQSQFHLVCRLLLE